MLKTICIIALAAALFYGVGEHILENSTISMVFNGEAMEYAFMENIVIGFVLAFLVLIGFLVMVGVFGAVFAAFIAAAFGLVVAGVSAFWPILLVALVVYFVFSKRPAIAS